MAMKGKTAACSLTLSVRGSWSVILIATVGVRIEHLSDQYTVPESESPGSCCLTCPLLLKTSGWG